MERDKGSVTKAHCWFSMDKGINPFPSRSVSPTTHPSRDQNLRRHVVEAVDEKQQLVQPGGQVCQPEHSWHHI